MLRKIPIRIFQSGIIIVNELVRDVLDGETGLANTTNANQN
jgi:hypothetical protein